MTFWDFAMQKPELALVMVLFISMGIAHCTLVNIKNIYRGDREDE
jgi:hypothetical protein